MTGNKKYWIIGIASFLIITIIFLSSKSKFVKSLYERVIDNYNDIDKDLTKELEILEKKRYEDSVYYNTLLVEKEAALNQQLIESQLYQNKLKLKLKKYEEELDLYRGADFDGKFELFSNTIIGKN